MTAQPVRSADARRWLAVLAIAIAPAATARATPPAERGAIDVAPEDEIRDVESTYSLETEPPGVEADDVVLSQSCGAMSVRAGSRRDERIGERLTVGHAFRGLGSPGHRLEIEAAWRSFVYGEDAHADGLAFDHFFRVDFVYANLSGAFGRMCLTGALDVDAVAGWADATSSGPRGEATGARLGARLGLLARARNDITRLRLELGVVFPSTDGGGGDATDARRIQAGAVGALARGPDDDIMTLTPLDWGVRAITRLEYHLAYPRSEHYGLWLDVRISVGYGRLRTRHGPRDGLLGGVALSILAGGGQIRDTEWSLRGGFRGAIGIGALWPSDYVLPLEILGVVELGHSNRESLSSVVALEAGVVFVRLGELELGEESYFKLGVRYVGSFDGT